MVSALRVLVLVLCLGGFAAPVFPQVISSPLPFIGLTPCRIADTRNPPGPYGAPALTGGVPRDFTLVGQCGIPASASAVSLNITVTNTVGPGFLLIFPQGGVQPVVSTLNYVAGQTVANAAVVPLGSGGSGGGVTVIAGVSGFDLIIDANGYYGSPAASASNVFLGPASGNSTMTGIDNTGIGANVLFNNTTGVNNTANGFSALALNTTGNSNTASGLVALINNTTGVGNTAIGAAALSSNTTGSGNTASGTQALTLSTGNGNIAIGKNAGINLTTGNSNIDIGNDGVSGESNTIRIGSGTHTRAFLGGVRAVTTGVNDAVAVMIDSAGQLGTTSSSRRVKRDIEDMGKASQALMKLRPVTFRYKASLDPTGSREYGLIAEEVAEAFPDLVVYDKGGEPETVRYHLLVPMLLNEVQKDRKAIAEDRQTIAEDRKAIAELTARLERLEALMSESR